MDISHVLVSQFNNLFGTVLHDYIKVDNRSVANSIHIILTTLFGLSMTYLISFLFKGEWKSLLQRIGLVKYSPTEFNHLSVTVPPDFSFQLLFGNSEEAKAFSKWMTKYNLTKIKNGNVIMGHGLMSLVGDEKVLTQNPKNFGELIREESLSDSMKEATPIWYGSDGHYVFAKRWFIGSNHVVDQYIDYNQYLLSSNSKKSLEEAVSDILKCMPVMTSKENDPTKLKIFKMEMNKHPNSKGEKSSKVYMGQVNSKKSFKYLFFEDKERLLNILDKFNSKTMFPESIPIENKLGLLLHGPPGTGKSAVIQCVANYTRRNIVLVDLSKIKTKKELDEVLLLDPTEHLFCFEEIDTVLGCVGQRSNEVQNPQPEDSTRDMIAMIAMASNQAIQKEMGNTMSQKDDALNLGYLLQKIDGIESAENRIIIATTNFPDKLDSALIRPGRFGFKLNLSYCTERMIKDILGMMYALSETEKNLLEIPSRLMNKLTPTHLIQICFQYETPEEVLNMTSV